MDIQTNNPVSFSFTKSLVTVTAILSLVLLLTGTAKADPGCLVRDTWTEYFVDEYGDGNCTIGNAKTNPDFLAGTGVARCTTSKSGNINCNCDGMHPLVLESTLIFNKTDDCCIQIDGGFGMVNNKSGGLGTPSGFAHATCQVKANE